MLTLIIYTLASLICLFVAIIVIAQNIVNDNTVKNYLHEFNIYKDDKIMYIVAHPDDEVMITGSLAHFKQKGACLAGIYLTHGEDGPTGNIVSKDALKQERTKELQNVSHVLGLDRLKKFDYPDRYLNTCNETDITNKLIEEIKDYKPTIIITFDTKMGLYGNTDHVTCGNIVHRLLKNNSYNVKGILVMTLPEQMIHLALKFSKTFKQKYNKKIGLPKPTVAVNITNVSKIKLLVTRCHKTQWQVMKDLQIYYNKMPSLIYYSIFNKEYFEYISL